MFARLIDPLQKLRKKRQPFEYRSYSAEDLSSRTIRQMTITANRLRAEKVAANHTQNQSNL
jgi:hypothetical protein